MVLIDSTLDFHRVAELKPASASIVDSNGSCDEPDLNHPKRTLTVNDAIQNAAYIATRLLNGGNPDYNGDPEQAYYWAKSTLVVCTDNPVFVPRAKNSTQENRGAGKKSDGVITADDFRMLFADQLEDGKDLGDIYNRVVEMFSLPPTFDTVAFWRSTGFRWILINEFVRELAKAEMGPDQVLVIDPYLDIKSQKAEWHYKINRLDLRVSDTENTTYAKLGALGQRVLSRHANIQTFARSRKGIKFPVSTVGEGEQKIPTYIHREDTKHNSYGVFCTDNDVVWSLFMMMPSLINPETGNIEKEIVVDLSQQTSATMTPSKENPVRFVDVVRLWAKILTHFAKYASLVRHPIETICFLACCTGSDFNDALEPSVYGLKTSEKVYWDTFSAIVASESTGYIDSTGTHVSFDVASSSREAVSNIIRTTCCTNHISECEHEIEISQTAFQIFYTACCSKSIESTQRSLQVNYNKLKKLPAPKKPKSNTSAPSVSFASTIRNIDQLVEIVEQLKTDAAALERLAIENPNKLPDKAVKTAMNLVTKIRKITITKERCETKRLNIQWTLNYMHKACTGRDVSVDTPLNISNSNLRESAGEINGPLPAVPDNYASILRQSKNWPWVVEAIHTPSSHDYNNSYHQVQCINDETAALSNRLDFYSVKTNEVLH